MQALSSVFAARRATSAFIFCALALLAPACMSQGHEVRAGEFVLYGSVVPTAIIPPAVAHRHDISPVPGRALLNVTVERRSGNARVNVEARVSAYAEDLNGRRRDIVLRRIVDNEQVSYAGAFDFLPNEVLDFVVSAATHGGSRPLQLDFRERMRGY